MAGWGGENRAANDIYDDDAIFYDDSFLAAVASVEAQHLGRISSVLSNNGAKICGEQMYGDGGLDRSIAGKRSAHWDGGQNNNNEQRTSGTNLSRGVDNSPAGLSYSEEENRKRIRTEDEMRSNWSTDQVRQGQPERSGSVRETQQTQQTQQRQEGEYMAALRGSNSEHWQASGGGRGLSSSAPLLPNRGGTSVGISGGAPGGTPGGASGGVLGGTSGACFKCGVEGHWSKDCPTGGGRGFNSPTKRAGGEGGQGPPNVPERLCPCGAGACLVLTANTEKNMGRNFYRCPLRQEEGQCKFFEWCDAGGQSVPTDRASNFPPGLNEQPLLQCVCGGGPCAVLTARTEKNMGRQFYKCPLPQSCSFFQWCDEAGKDEGRGSAFTPTRVPNFPGNASSPSPASGSNACYKCGQEGHWARDCPNQQSQFSGSFGGGGGGGQSQPYSSNGGGSAEGRSTGNCFKCGGQGHWSTSCPEAGGTPSGSKSSAPNACYKCGKSGHWSNNCPSTPWQKY